MRTFIVNFVVNNIYFPLVKMKYKPNYERIEMRDLQNYPNDTVGYSVFKFLTKRNLKLFYGYELHDIKHAVLGFETNIEGEIAMQFFEYGNGNHSFSVSIVVYLGWLIMPERIPVFIKAYQYGKSCTNIHSLNLIDQLHTPLLKLHKQLYKNEY